MIPAVVRLQVPRRASQPWRCAPDGGRRDRVAYPEAQMTVADRQAIRDHRPALLLAAAVVID
jgi:hypothetical protein